MSAREHHIQMKYLLARMAAQNPDRFFATFGPGGDTAYLADLWTAVGEDLPADERVPNTGVAAWQTPDGVVPAVLVLTLPAPVARNEAYFLGAARAAGGGCRVFCLERAADPPAGQGGTVLAELGGGGRSHWGPGCAPAAQVFAADVAAVVADPSARPLSFVPMPAG